MNAEPVSNEQPKTDASLSRKSAVRFRPQPHSVGEGKSDKNRTQPHFIQSWCADNCRHFEQAIDREMLALQAPREQCFIEFALRCLINPANAEAGRVLAQLVKERAQLEVEASS